MLFSYRYALCIIYTIIVLLLSVRAAPAAEMIIVNVVLNQEEKGEFFVHLTEAKDILFKPEDLVALGFAKPSGRTVDIAGVPALSLRSMPGVSYEFDEKSVSLKIVALPELLTGRTMDFTAPRRSQVLRPRETSAFLNYRVDYLGGDLAGYRNVTVNNELGVRKGDVLFLTNTTYSEKAEASRFVRLFSSLTYDRRDTLDRFVAGDFFASSGDLGSTLTMGGLSFSKAYSIDPYLVRYPTINFSGVVASPSEVEVYLNGARIRTERIQPGTFNFTGLRTTSGAGVVEVLIRDPFGREQWIRHPYYFTDVLLKKGFHDVSYNLGYLREDFGIDSNNYGDLAFSAFHRYGFRDFLTLGFRGEASDGRYNLGPQGTYLVGSAGTITVSLSGSLDRRGEEGAAGSFSYAYLGRKMNARLLIKGFTRHYAAVADDPDEYSVRSEFGAGIGYSTRKFGSLNLDFTQTKRYAGAERETGTLTYSRPLSRNASLFATASRIEEAGTEYEGFIGLTVYPGRDHSLSANYRRDKETNTESLLLQKNQPPGEGTGYRLAVERVGAENTSYSVNPSVQQNTRYAILRGAYFAKNSETVDSRTYNLSAAGALVAVGGTLGLIRPVDDSFALVTVGNVEDVRVYRNNQEIGRTNARGKVFIPDLGSYYDTLISIDGNDVPIDHYMPQVRKYVSPPLRSGSVIDFAIKKIQAVTGTLTVQVRKRLRPVELTEISVEMNGMVRTFPTGRGGVFYLEDIAPGTYEAWFLLDGHHHVFNLVIPESDDMIIDLGGIIL